MTFPDLTDHDTRELGTEPPFHCWEGGQSALVSILLEASSLGLTLAQNANELAGMVYRSRWFAAATDPTDEHPTNPPESRATVSNALAESFTPGMRVDQKDGRQNGGEVTRVDVTRDPKLIVEVQWPTGDPTEVEWCDPEDLRVHHPASAP